MDKEIVPVRRATLHALSIFVKEVAGLHSGKLTDSADKLLQELSYDQTSPSVRVNPEGHGAKPEEG